MIFKRVLLGRHLYENCEVKTEGGYVSSVRAGLDHWEVGGILVPVFADTHAHFTSYALSINRPRLDGIKRVEDALDFISKKLEEVEGEVVIMEGYDDSAWGRTPTKRDLDRITSRPLILRRVCGHKAVLNSSAINWLKERYGDIPGLDESSGLAVEHLPLNLNRYVPPEEREVEKAIERAESLAGRLGVLLIGENTRGFFIRKLVEMDRAGRLSLMWRVAVYYDELEGVKDLLNYRSENFRIVGVKEFLDGSVGARTASFSFPYTDTGEKAPLLHGDDYLKEVVEKAERLGLGVWFHAIGDEAIEQALRVLETSSNPGKHRIEHFLFPRAEHYRKAAALGVWVSLQPNFTYRWGRLHGMYHRVVGDAIYWHNRFRTMENLSVRYAFGSDTMPPGPLYGIRGALKHPLPEERLTLAEALYRYTTAGAEMLGEESVGRLEVGKKALFSTVSEECVGIS